MFAKIIAAVILSALTLAAQSAPRRKPLYPKPTFTKHRSSKAAKHSRASHPASPKSPKRKARRAGRKP
jgi:hypothetical protein